MENGKRFLWSPDGGYFVAVGDKCYWGDGEVTGWPARVGVHGQEPYHSEDYSSWSDEKRASVLAEHSAKRERQLKESRERYERLERAALAIESKLTAEEIETLKTYYGQ